MRPPHAIENAARARIANVDDQIRHSLEMVRDRNPLAAEWEPERLRRRLQTKARLSRGEAAALATGIQAYARADEKARAAVERKAPGPERIYGDTIDFVGVSFLERGARAAQAVARVAFRDGRPRGSGFMVSDRLFLTNNHVIGAPGQASQFALEFDYELDTGGQRLEVTRFLLDPGTFFVTNREDDLDFTLIAVGSRDAGRRELREFGWCPLSDANDKHALGEIANIVQHPDGRYKEVVLRENRLVSRLDTVLHYVADTEPGSSGSPVFNNEWEVIALHHWGGPWRQRTDDGGRPVPVEVNEGIRTSAIVATLRGLASGLGPAERALLERAFVAGEVSRGPVGPARPTPQVDGADGTPRLEPDGQVIWRIPVEISVRLPGLGGALPQPPSGQGATVTAVAPPQAERKVEIDRDYDNRPGYKPAFISGFPISLPKLSAAQRAIAAKNREADAGEHPFELRYQHFSIVMNRRRKLAFFTACNIDGKNSKDIDRDTGAITPRKPGGSEASSEGAEASETWFSDDRLAEGDALTQKLYAGQEVPGFPNKQTRAWQNRMFQRGHLVRRTDPAWGTDARALRANNDTFHFTNSTPQVGFFNMGTAPKGLPKSGGGQLWRALEDYVLDNAVDELKRVSVFTGPILDDDDPLWREHIVAGFRVPLRFWKIVAWAADGRLHATAMIADQEPVIKVMPEALEGAEVFADTSKVEDFLTTVEEIERLTDLDFGPALRAADDNGGEGLGGRESGQGKRAPMRRVYSLDDLPLARASVR